MSSRPFFFFIYIISMRQQKGWKHSSRSSDRVCSTPIHLKSESKHKNTCLQPKSSVEIQCIYGSGETKKFSVYNTLKYFQGQEKINFASLFETILFSGKSECDYDLNEYIFTEIVSLSMKKNQDTTKCAVYMGKLFGDLTHIEFDISLDLGHQGDLQNIYPGLYSFVVSKHQVRNADSPNRESKFKPKLKTFVKQKIGVLSQQTYFMGFIIDSKHVNFLSFGQDTLLQPTQHQNAKRCFQCDIPIADPVFCQCKHVYYCGEEHKEHDRINRHQFVCSYK